MRSRLLSRPVERIANRLVKVAVGRVALHSVAFIDLMLASHFMLSSGEKAVRAI
jgi:hypothetical protein